MTFYQACLGGELSFQTVAETPIVNQCPAGMQQHIMHSQLVNGGAVMMASENVTHVLLRRMEKGK